MASIKCLFATSLLLAYLLGNLSISIDYHALLFLYEFRSKLHDWPTVDELDAVVLVDDGRMEALKRNREVAGSEKRSVEDGKAGLVFDLVQSAETKKNETLPHAARWLEILINIKSLKRILNRLDQHFFIVYCDASND